VNLLDRRSDLLVAQIDALRDAVRRAPFHIEAWVVLPDHMHCLWTLPEGDADFPGRWRAQDRIFKSLGRIRRFAAASRLGFTLPVGSAPARNCSRPASAGKAENVGMRRPYGAAVPTVRSASSPAVAG
jgi:hypothetical protein